MANWLRWLLVGWILLAAATLRLTGLAWDELLNYHPDERYIAWVGTTVEWPERWDAAAFSPQHSSFNPYYWPAEATTDGILVFQDTPRDFAYGHLPLYLGVAATRLAERLAPRLASYLPSDWLLTQAVLNQHDYIEFDHITIVGRVITALFDVGTVGLIYLLGRWLYGEMVGLLAAALLTVTVLHLQLAHFYTVDPFLTFFCVACLYFLLTSRPTPITANDQAPVPVSQPRLLLAAAMAGLAVGAKFAAILLLVPLTLGYALDRTRPRFHRFLLFTLGIGVAFLTFFLSNPFAVLDHSCQGISPQIVVGPVRVPSLVWRSCFLTNVVREGMMASGQSDLGFTRQYAGTLPYLYFGEMQLKWGLGAFLGAAAWLGLLFWLLRWLRLVWSAGKWEVLAQPEVYGELLLLSWVLLFGLTTGRFYVKFMRYMQPITPMLVLFAAAFLVQLRPRWLRNSATALVLITTTAYALAFSNIYEQRHPWAAASQWIYDHIEPGAIIYSEQWDDPLPTSLDSTGSVRQYQTEPELTWLTYPDERDTVERLQANLQLAAAADYLVISSQRIYGVVPRQPDRFPLSSQYHQLLFSGQLGYKPVYTITRMPRLGNFHLKWDTFTWAGLTPPPEVAAYFNHLPGITLGRADESFTVYDQPLPIIFANMERLTSEEMLTRFTLP